MEELLTGRESAALRKRLGFSEGGGGPVTVQDVAEATGLTEAEVVAQIRQIRAETAFTEPKAAPAPSPLPGSPPEPSWWPSG